MKPETLNSLLLDRALGELDAATQELLGEYLVAHPAEAARASDLERTLAAAKAAVRVQPARAEALQEASMPPARGWRVRPEWVRLAACVAVGAFAGWFAHGTLSGERQRAIARAAAVPAVVDAPLLPAAATGVISAVPPPPALRSMPDYPRVARYRLRWDSPMNRPHYEEKP